MVEVIIHYVSGGEKVTTSVARDHPARPMEPSRAPVAGELIESPQGGGVEQVIQVVHSRDGTVHAFVAPVSPPPYVAQAFGITGSE